MDANEPKDPENNNEQGQQTATSKPIKNAPPAKPEGDPEGDPNDVGPAGDYSR